MIRVENKNRGGACRKRNLLMIVAIILTTLLFTTIFSIGIRYWNEVSERSVQMEGMKFDIQLSEPEPDQVKKVLAMDSVRYAFLRPAWRERN